MLGSHRCPAVRLAPHDDSNQALLSHLPLQTRVAKLPKSVLKARAHKSTSDIPLDLLLAGACCCLELCCAVPCWLYRVVLCGGMPCCAVWCLMLRGCEAPGTYAAAVLSCHCLPPLPRSERPDGSEPRLRWPAAVPGCPPVWVASPPAPCSSPPSCCSAKEYCPPELTLIVSHTSPWLFPPPLCTLTPSPAAFLSPHF